MVKKMFPIGHFALGYTITIIILLATGLYKVIYRDIFVGCIGGFVAIFPDIHWILPEPYAYQVHLFHSSPWADICFLHYTIDTHVNDYDFFWPVLCIAIAIILTLALIHWDNRHKRCTLYDGKFSCKIK